MMYIVKRWNSAEIAPATATGYGIETFAGHRRFTKMDDAVQFAESEKNTWDYIDILEGKATDSHPNLNLFKSYQKGKEQQ